MRAGADRVETLGSFWWFDPDAREYLRMPKREGPRERGPNGEDWGGPDAGALEDLTWHPYFSWRIEKRAHQDVLVICLSEGSHLQVVAPVMEHEGGYVLFRPSPGTRKSPGP